MYLRCSGFENRDSLMIFGPWGALGRSGGASGVSWGASGGSRGIPWALSGSWSAPGALLAALGAQLALLGPPPLEAPPGPVVA